MTKQLSLHGFVISVTHKAIRNLYLRMGESPDHLRVSAPFGTGDKEILSFVASKIQWIEKHRQNLPRQKTKKEFSPEKGCPVFVWGKCLFIDFSETDPSKGIILSGSSLMLPFSEHSGTKEKKEALCTWLVGILDKEIRVFVEKWSGILKVSPRRVVIRPMKTRWGSCTPALESIRINFSLVHLEKLFLDYVVLHELVHLLEPSHNARFSGFMDQWMPDWRETRRRLKENSLKNFEIL